MIMRVLAGFIAGKRAEAAFLARRTGFMAAAGAFAFIGVIFVSLAVWIVLARFLGSIAASAIFGMIYLGVGFWLFRTAKRMEAKAGPQVAAGVAAGAAGPAALAAEQAAVQHDLNTETGGSATTPPPVTPEPTGIKGMVPILAEAFIVGLFSTATRRK